jgi:quinol monooxygenase YgiN
LPLCAVAIRAASRPSAVAHVLTNRDHSPHEPWLVSCTTPLYGAVMEPVTIINQLVIKPGRMDELVQAQRRFAGIVLATPHGLIGSRMYRGIDGTTAILVSQFVSRAAQEALRQHPDFKRHLSTLQPLIESSNPGLFEEAYTSGAFL